MYLRFITAETDYRTGRMKGIFTLTYELLREGQLSANDEAPVRELLRWFEQNLGVPTKFSKKRNVSHKNTHGLSWIKPEASEAIEKFWALKGYLEQAGYHIDVLKVKNPGKIVYQDKMQLVAEPYG